MSASCFFIKPPRIALVFIYPLNGHQGFSTKALEMSMSYQRNPPGLDHETIVVCNGAPATQPSKDLFSPLPNLSFIDHDNSGWDIGGFQAAARASTADVMMFFSAHTYFRKPGWLARMLKMFEELGDTLFGATGNQGDMNVNVWPHVRTTAFLCSREMFLKYPHQVSTQGGGGERYEFEHGKTCLTNWFKSMGRQPWIVAWDVAMPVEQCDSIVNGYHKANQENLLVGDRLTAPPYWGVP